METGTAHAAHRHTNHLIHETSPYLLQHAHNPVDWYPWGTEAFARAQAEDKPIVLSVGYAACHWCHVMAAESFENEAIARLMNELFICIKVDREERPDVDALYMDAVQQLTGSGGWPMTVFLTPQGMPFAGGTYFPPEDRYNMPGFPRVLQSMAESYRTRRAEVDEQADLFQRFYEAQRTATFALPEGLAPATAVVQPQVIYQAVASHLPLFDATHGGFGGAPKFPHPMNLAFLLRALRRARADSGPHALHADVRAALEGLLRQTLDAMAAGGIYDQIGGGFHRYATDIRWQVPHFEKMLYDNALLAPAYLAAWQYFGEERYRRICEEILDYVRRDMTDPSGGFYATQDADSVDGEGQYYVWTREQLREALGAADAPIAEQFWGVTASGNFAGANVLHIARDAGAIASAVAMSESEVRAILARARARLAAVRAERVAPARDDKVLAVWNGLMLRAFADAARALGREEYRAAAVQNATFLCERMMDGDRLRRSWRQGHARLDAYLDDYASVANGLLSAYEASGELRFFHVARQLVDTLLTRFWDETAGSFFDTSAEHPPLIGRPRELADNAVPSGMSLAAEALLRLAGFTGAARYHEFAARVLVPLAPAMVEQPLMFGQLLCALDDFVGPLYEVAVVGAPEDPATRELRHVLDTLSQPRMVLAQADPNDTAAQAEVPLLAERPLVTGQPAVYVCQGFLCRQPVTRPESLAPLLQP